MRPNEEMLLPDAKLPSRLNVHKTGSQKSHVSKKKNTFLSPAVRITFLFGLCFVPREKNYVSLGLFHRPLKICSRDKFYVRKLLFQDLSRHDETIEQFRSSLMRKNTKLPGR